LASLAVALAARADSQRITLAPTTGSVLTGSVVAGTLRGTASTTYILAAKAGQRIWFDLQSANPGATFTIRRDGAPPVFDGSVLGNSVILTVPTRGDWRIEVALTPTAARKHQTATYRLTISNAARIVSAPPQGPAVSIFALMPQTCRTAVASVTSLPLRTLKPYAARPNGQGYQVMVQSTANLRQLACRFDPMGNLLGFE
jgi:hypothetical protein